MSEQILKPISHHQSTNSTGEIALQPLELDENEKKRRAAELFDTSDLETAIPSQPNITVLPENTVVTGEIMTPIVVESTAPVKAAMVSSQNNIGWKLFGGVMLLAGVGVAAGGAGSGSGGSSSSNSGNGDSNHHATNNTTESDLATPVVSLNPLTNINQTNQTQTFTLSGSLKADSTATQNTVAVMIHGKTHSATVSGNTWTLDIAGRDLASQQGTQDIFVTAVSMRGDKMVSSKTVSGSLNVDTQISTPKVSLNDVPDQLSTQKQTVTISGSLNNVDADATVQVRVKLNNGKEKIATVSSNTWKLDISGDELMSKMGTNHITVTAIATDKAGNTAQHSDSDTFTVYQPTTTQIVYETGKTADIAGSTATAFNMRSLKDSATVSEQTLRSEYETTFGKDKIAANIQAAYGKDSDNDGVIDRNDKNPNTWDVSERDLRFFATVAYEDSATLKAAFNDDKTEIINKINNNSDNFYQKADIRELTENWTLLESAAQRTGLDFAIYGNGKKADGSYTNVVVAFRGTQGIKDIISDIGVGIGKLIDEVKYFEKLANDMMTKYSPEKVYTTGHSLGGYLAQYFASHTMQQTVERKTAFQHSAIFNPAKLTTNANGVLNKAEQMYQTTWQDLSDKTNPKNLHQSDSYVIKGDVVTYGDVPAKYAVGGAGLTAAGIALSAVPVFGWFFGGLAVLAGAATATAIVFDGLGSYSNTTVLDGFTGDSIDKHFKNNFFKNHAKLETIFSKGYRVDKWYVNDDTDGDGLTDVQENHLGTAVKSATVINGTDTDKDGFSDRLEIELGADWTTAQKAVALSADRATHFAVAATKTTDTGAFISAQGIELTAQMNGKTIHYTPNGNAINLGIASNEEWQTWLDAGSKIQSGSHDKDTLSGSHVAQIIYGGSGNDTLTAGSAQTVLIGGSGSDTFKFNASHLTSGKMNIISDLTAIDKLDFSGSKSLFSSSSTFKWTNVLGDESLLAKNDAALIWQDSSNTLSYKAQGSSELHTFARFDDSQTLATLQAALIA